MCLTRNKGRQQTDSTAQNSQPQSDVPAVVVTPDSIAAPQAGEGAARKKRNTAAGSTFNLGGPSLGSAGDSGFAPIARVTLGQ